MTIVVNTVNRVATASRGRCRKARDGLRAWAVTGGPLRQPTRILATATADGTGFPVRVGGTVVVLLRAFGG